MHSPLKDTNRSLLLNFKGLVVEGVDCVQHRLGDGIGGPAECTVALGFGIFAILDHLDVVGLERGNASNLDLVGHDGVDLGLQLLQPLIWEERYPWVHHLHVERATIAQHTYVGIFATSCHELVVYRGKKNQSKVRLRSCNKCSVSTRVLTIGSVGFL